MDLPPAAAAAPPPSNTPYTVHGLGACQSSYGSGSASACAFTSTLFAVYLVGSPGRKPRGTVARLSRWMQMGCYLYEKNRTGIASKQSRKANDPAQRNTDANVAAELVFQVSNYMEKIGDFACIMREARVGEQLSADQLLALQGALPTLEQILVKMALHALVKPVAGTMVTADKHSVHTIGMRVKATQEAQSAAAMLLVVLDPEGNAATYESVKMTDFDQALGCLHIDFIDSHSNSARTGLTEPNGVGVWITFDTLTALRDYILRRYRRPVVRPQHTANKAAIEEEPPRNCFDMQIWSEKKNKEDDHEERRTEFLALFEEPEFIEWKSGKRKRQRDSE